MSEISKPDYRYVWSSGGANVLPSTTKIQTGWTSEVPPHQWENALQNRQDNMLVHINQHGIPQWDSLTEYFGVKSYVTGSDGQVYRSVQNSGPNTITQDPTTDASDTYWRLAFADANGNYITQTTGDARYLQRSNNLSDLTNATTARSNLGVVAATDTVAGLIELATQSEVNTGTDAVRAITPLTLKTLFGGANQQLAANGYQKLPSGMIIQWGSLPITAASTAIVTFPVAFTTATVSVVANSQRAAVGSGDVSCHTFTLTTVSIVNGSSAGTGVHTHNWIALGY